MTAALGVCAALLAARAAGFWGFLLGGGVLDAESVRLWLTRGLGPLALAGAAWTAAWGTGRRGLRLLRAPADDVAAATLGFGLLGTAVFVLGAAGLLRPGPLAVLAAVFALVGATGLRRPTLHAPRWTRAEGAAAGLLAFAGLCALLRALAPPTEWDVRAYHLALPELALASGRLASVPWLLHSHWPRLMEGLYALPLAAGSDGAAALLHLGAAALLVGAVFAAGREAAGPAAGWTAALLLAAQPAFLKEAGTAHSDAAAALFVFAAARLLARGGRGSLLAAGLLAGLAAAAKMTGLAVLAAWTAELAWRGRRRDAALFLACGLAVVGPWLARTWLETGDPVWPFLPRLFGLPSEAATLLARNQASNVWGWPPPAWALTADGPGFLLVPLAGLRALARPRERAAGAERELLVAGAALAPLVLTQHSAWRYLMPVWPALALAAGRSASAAFARGAWRRPAAAALVLAGAVPIVLASPNNELFAVVAPRPASAPAADRRELWEDRALEGLPGFYREARGVLPPDARVLLWREVRGYGAGFDYLWGDPKNQALIDYRAVPDPDALYARLRALGVTHVLDHPASVLYREDPGYYDARTLALMSECLRRRARPVLARDGFVLHQLL